MGITMFAGEAEGRLDLVLRDAAAGQLAPVYDFLKALPGLEDTPEPLLPARYVQRTLGKSTSFDAGRGCPYQCSFCTIINVQGRKSRSRSPDDVERLVRGNWAQGIHKFFITDDNFGRNKDWEPIFDRLIELREQHAIPLGLMIQVDTLCHKIPNFVEKAKRAGVTRVFIGLEKTLLRRPPATGVSLRSLVTVLVPFATTVRLEGVHPLQGGILRLKHPSLRRPGLKHESSWLFWPRFAAGVVYKHAILAGTIIRLLHWKRAIERDPDARSYIDLALTPVADDDEDMLDLLTKTTGGAASVVHARKVAGRPHAPAMAG
jgi:hypothetical protein